MAENNLITRTTGFTGSHFTELLDENGFKVIALDCLSGTVRDGCLALAFLREYLDNTIKTVEGIENFVLNILGIVPALSSGMVPGSKQITSVPWKREFQTLHRSSLRKKILNCLSLKHTEVS